MYVNDFIMFSFVNFDGELWCYCVVGCFINIVVGRVCKKKKLNNLCLKYLERYGFFIENYLECFGI